MPGYLFISLLHLVVADSTFSEHHADTLSCTFMLATHVIVDKDVVLGHVNDCNMSSVPCSIAQFLASLS